MTASENAMPGLRRPGISTRAAQWWGPRPLVQAVVIFVVLAFVLLLAGNAGETMRRIGVMPGFGFLTRSANFEIGESVIAFKAGDPYIRAILAGLLNTVKVAALGCVLATLLGVILGIASLSGNLLLAGLVRWYVEVVRNVPLLLQLFFWIALAKAFPPPRQALSAFGAIFLSNRGVFVPSFALENVSAAFVAVSIAGLGAFILFPVLIGPPGRMSSRRFILAGIALLVGCGVAFQLTSASVHIELPALAGFNIRGGWTLTPEFAALLTGLTVKFSAAIAEIVRAGIQSVDRGQWEAARALGLHDARIMRLVVLPQALRIITPLTTSTYLDLTKDSSLAVAIGYPDLVSIVNTTANTTGQSFEALAILIAVFLVLNLSVSFAMNVYNRRVALRGGGGR